MRKSTTIALIISFVFPCLISLAVAEDQMAVESTGEINAKDNSTGTVIAGTPADLVLTIIADMSQAEPGEEIESIQITMPLGFSAKDNAVTAVAKIVGAEKIPMPNFESVVDRNRIIVTLPTLISLTTIVMIEFTVVAPASPVTPPPFIVGLLNIFQNPILVSIKPGNADGRINNDSFAIKVVAATKPLPPSGLMVQPDPSGENDLIISWTKSDDPVVSGYLIYRGDEPIDIPSREQTSYTDRDLEAGKEYSYNVHSYKTQVLKSDASNTASAIAPEDTKSPWPPIIRPEARVIEKGGKEGIEIVWEASLSRDVLKYIVYRGASLDSLSPIGEVDPEADVVEYSYVDANPPAAGSYLYVVGAVDDAENETKSSATLSRQALSGAEPQPNPFTPLSADSRYNQVIFPAALVEGGEGTFAVKIYDLEGDLVADEEAAEGSKEIRWDGKDMNDEYVDGGVYVYQATMGDKYKIGTVIVAK